MEGYYIFDSFSTVLIYRGLEKRSMYQLFLRYISFYISTIIYFRNSNLRKQNFNNYQLILQKLKNQKYVFFYIGKTIKLLFQRITDRY